MLARTSARLRVEMLEEPEVWVVREDSAPENSAYDEPIGTMGWKALMLSVLEVPMMP
jgi:hypothetical protein